MRLGELLLAAAGAIDCGLSDGSEQFLVGRRLRGGLVGLLLRWLLVWVLLRLAEVVGVYARGLAGADWLILVVLLMLIGRLAVRLPAVTMHEHLLLAVGSIRSANLILCLGLCLVLPHSGFRRLLWGRLLKLLRLLACRTDLLHNLLL